MDTGWLRGRYRIEGFQGIERKKRKFSSPYARQGKELLRGNLNFSIKPEPPILVFCRGEGVEGTGRVGWGH